MTDLPPMDPKLQVDWDKHALQVSRDWIRDIDAEFCKVMIKAAIDSEDAIAKEKQKRYEESKKLDQN